MKKVKVELKKKEEAEYLDPVKSQGAYITEVEASPFVQHPRWLLQRRGIEATKRSSWEIFRWPLRSTQKQSRYARFCG